MVLRHPFLSLALGLGFVFTCRTLVADESLPVVHLAALPAQPAEPLTNSGTPAKIELGRLLFFDPVLSATQQVACATCHHPQHGWADGRATPLGVHASGLGPKRRLVEANHLPVLQRNTPTILNVAFNGLAAGTPYDPTAAPMFWDNRVQGLETQALVPLRNREEMRGDVCTESQAVPAMVERLQAIEAYRQRFADAFQGEITAERVTMAIAAYERTLIATDTAFDRFQRGDSQALSPLQQRGLQVFQRAGCALCHNGPMLSDYKLHVLGAPGERRAFRTPSLRQLQDTAPFMHNGALKTLSDVLIFYDQLMDTVSETLDGGDAAAQPALDPLLRQLHFQPDDHEPLLAFLASLSSDRYDRTLPGGVPSGLPVAGTKP